MALIWTKIFAQSVDKELDLSAGGAGEDVEGLPIDEEFAEITQPESKLS